MKQLIAIIKVDEEESNYDIKGNMSTGMIKLMIGELEIIKSRLIFDLEKSLEE